MNFFHPRAALGAIALSMLLAACGGGGSGSEPGTMRMSVTDAPACGYDAVNVTIEKVRIHQSSSAADSDAGWSEVVLNPARRVDLLTLNNGVLEELGQTQLPAGKYTQLRLVLAENKPSQPMANSVVPTGASETALDTPSGQQSGLKLNANIDVPAGKIADVVLDFDACKSVVKRSSSGQYNLKPVIAVIPLLSTAGMRIEGWVDPAIATSATSVSAQSQGTPVKATFPDTTGRFVLYPVPVGSYDLVVNAAGRVTAVMTGVPVSDTAPTFVGSQTVRIVPATATSAPRRVTGSVTPATATVRALQAFSRWADRRSGLAIGRRWQRSVRAGSFRRRPAEDLVCAECRADCLHGRLRDRRPLHPGSHIGGNQEDREHQRHVPCACGGVLLPLSVFMSWCTATQLPPCRHPVNSF